MADVSSSQSARGTPTAVSSTPRERHRHDEDREQGKIPSFRRNKYKDKFYSLREKFDQVTSSREEYERDLATAEAKVKSLQAECDLLLDAIALQAPSHPALAGYDRQTPTPPPVSEHGPVGGQANGGAPMTPSELPGAHRYTNGITNGHVETNQHHHNGATNGHQRYPHRSAANETSETDHASSGFNPSSSAHRHQESE